VLLPLLFLAESVRADELALRLSAVLDAPALRGARVGALVVDASDGRVLFERDADLPLVPASNQKLLTALAALASFGPTHRFTTRVLADRAPDAEGAVGWLVLQGGGDPALTSEEWWRLAKELRRTGLRQVEGDLLLDASIFDGERWHASWGPVADRGYLGPVSGLAANFGAYQVFVTPGAVAGEAPRLSMDPEVSYLALVNRAVTVAAGQPAILGVESLPGPGRETVIVSGTIAAGAPTERISRRVSDPVAYAGAVARRQLMAAEIDVAGEPRAGPAPPGAVEILAFEGPPLAEAVALLLKESNNTIAETLVKDLGAAASGPPGSWPSGTVAVREALAARGVDARTLALVDGSGLSREDRVTARTIVDVLRSAAGDFLLGPELMAALPIAGRDGTLRSRFREAPAPVRAKTGYLDGVVALSGFARSPAGGERIFSLLLNGVRGDPTAAMAAADRFAAALTER
jgi:D-alanyl-D-alanine carboxypeptidase/D-alanyl-D-alanine-endopeptidase (penicillin-binding protein 4)